jgi:hypothetical protein
MVTGVWDKLGILAAAPDDPASPPYIYDENSAGAFILPREVGKGDRALAR